MSFPLHFLALTALTSTLYSTIDYDRDIAGSVRKSTPYAPGLDPPGFIAAAPDHSQHRPAGGKRLGSTTITLDLDRSAAGAGSGTD